MLLCRLMFTDFISTLPFDLMIYSLLCWCMCFDQFSVVDSVFAIELFHVFTLSFHCCSDLFFLLFLFVCCSIDWIDMFRYCVHFSTSLTSHPFLLFVPGRFRGMGKSRWDAQRCYWRMAAPQSWTKMMNMTMKFQEPLRDYVWDLKIKFLWRFLCVRINPWHKPPHRYLCHVSLPL